MSKFKNNIVLLTMLASTVFTANVFSLVVTTTNNGNTLANNISGTGITISNVTYTGANGSSGTFTGGNASGLGIDKGIILTTGQAVDAVGPNSSSSTTTNNGHAGDADLDTLVAPNATNDATVLTIDFTSTSNNLYFKYVFASEEYNEYVDSSFNDVFGFFLDGVNIGILPSGHAVSVNTVNCGNPFSGAGPNCGLFNNNEASSPVFDLEYDGFTNTLIASATNLTSGLHTIKLAIADTSDFAFDSAVFIESGSLQDSSPVPEPSTILLMGLGLFALTFASKRRKSIS